MDPDIMLTNQVRLVNNITNFIRNTKQKKGAALQTVNYFEARLQLLQKYLENLYTRHQLLTEHEKSKEKHEYFAKQGFELAEQCYVDAVAELSANIERMRNTAAPHPADNQLVLPRVNFDQVKIPQVSLPTFSGKCDEWESFKQRFMSLISNKSEYSDVNKLQYLLSTLQGKAAARLQNIEIVGENFVVAWELLERRYGNRRRRLENHLEKLIQLNTVRLKNDQDLSELLDNVEVLVRAQKELGCNIQHYNHWLVHCISRKLDDHTKETWKFTQESSDEFYQYSELTKFIERRIDSLDAESERIENRAAGGSSNKSSHKNKSYKTMPTSVHNAVTIDSDSASNKRLIVCAQCQGNHSLNFCDQFNLMNPSQRFDFCKKLKLCLNCLREAHGVSDCRSPNRCLLCKQKHHTKLHFDSKTPRFNSPNGSSKSREIASSTETPQITVSSNLASSANSISVRLARKPRHCSHPDRSRSATLIHY